MNSVESAPNFGGAAPQSTGPNFGGAAPQSSGPAGGNAPTAQQFHIGSPMSDPLFGARANVPQAPSSWSQQNGSNVPYDPWSSAAGRTSAPPQAPPAVNQMHSGRTFNTKEWNVSDKKVSKALTLFNGQAQHYRNWSDRMKDHSKEVNLGYGEIFNWIEQSKNRISNTSLNMGH